MQTVSIVFGGSVLAPAELDAPFLVRVAHALTEWSKAVRLAVVVGGGSPARRYIEAARTAGVGEQALDRIGIQATRLNAQTLASIIANVGGNVNARVPLTLNDAVAKAAKHQILVMGGTEPGHSTDHVAVELAIALKAARFVNATNVDGVYTRDPAKHKDAKRLETLTFEELLQIIEEREWTAAGAPGVLDGPSTVLVATKGVPTRICKGTDLENLGRAVLGQSFSGTSISGTAVNLP